MKRIAAFLISVIASVSVHAAETQTPEKMAAAFFETFMKGDSAKAVDELFSINPLIKEKPQQLQLLKSQLTTISQLYGAPFAVELVSVEDLTPSLQRRVYITKHEWHPVTWEIYFYKPRGEWLPDQLVFADKYEVLGRKSNRITKPLQPIRTDTLRSG
ncbi:MAG TPA: hypothetical protein VLX11_09990 [Candidatus Acidoferrales bacterium]|nr:hypothetical protein [Candidatus Acidoferrales bacterium]